MKTINKDYFSVRYTAPGDVNGELTAQHKSQGDATAHAMMLKSMESLDWPEDGRIKETRSYFVVHVVETLEETVCDMTIAEAEAMGLLEKDREISQVAILEKQEKFMKVFHEYIFAKAPKGGFDDISTRALELIKEIKAIDPEGFFSWMDFGSTLKLRDLLGRTTYRGNGNTPEQLLDFNAFATLDTIGMYYREGYLVNETENDHAKV